MSHKNKTSKMQNQGTPAQLNLDICPDCENHVKDTQKSLMCEKCMQWWHPKCAGIKPN